MEPIDIKYTQQQIDGKRTLVSKLFMEKSSNIKTPDIKVMSAKDVELLFDLYDMVFFDFWFRDSFRGRLEFSLSKRMTKSAGMTVCPKNIMNMNIEEVVIEIKIAVDIILSYGVLENSTKVGGIQVASSLQALQLVMEHEIIHVLEFIAYGRSSCKGKRFKAMVHNIFGHTESTHTLPISGRIAYENLDLGIGSMVSFSFKGEKLSGMIVSVNKRAVVMVADRKGRWQDPGGNRYSKYYVSLNELTKGK